MLAALCTSADIQKSTLLCNEYKNLKRSECFWSLKTCFFFGGFFSKWIMSALLSFSQSLTVTHTLCQENVFKFESRKNHTFCLSSFKELQNLRFNHLVKNDEIASACAQLVLQYRVLIGQSPYLVRK